jgi:hypothetical protein
LNDHAKDLGGEAEKKSQEIGKCKKNWQCKIFFLALIISIRLLNGIFLFLI